VNAATEYPELAAVATGTGSKPSTAADRALLACVVAIGSVKSRTAQVLDDGDVYVECSAAYVCHLFGVGYGSALAAFASLGEQLAWRQVDPGAARAAGVRLRTLRPNQRWGRHLLIPGPSWDAVQRAARDLTDGGVRLPEPESTDWSAALTTGPPSRMPVGASGSERGRTSATRCPCPAHSGGDRRPSLVVWETLRGAGTGGCRCMVSGQLGQWRTAPDGLTVEVVFRPRTAPVTAGPTADTGDRRHIEPIGGDPGPVGGRAGYAGVGPRRGHEAGRLEHWATPDGPRSGVVAGGRRVAPGGSAPGVIDVLLRADAVARGPAATARAVSVGQTWAPVPDLLLTGAVVTPASWREQPIVGADGFPDVVAVPATWRAVRQRWVTVDLDDVWGLDDDDDLGGFDVRLRRLLRRHPAMRAELSGRYAVVRTGPTGLHVWLELRHERVDPQGWWASRDVQVWFADVSGAVAGALLRSGVRHAEVDRATWSADRWFRRPGWRRLADGSLFLARLVAVDRDGVRSRERAEPPRRGR